MAGVGPLGGDTKPYIDFYREHCISPVSQDISDLRKHLSCRDFLYRSLGLAPFSFEGRSVIELGPGSGHNALYVASRNPLRYVLVEGNPTGYEQTRRLLRQYFNQSDALEFVHSDILEFTSESLFDIVLCEGVIPHQKDPRTFAQHVAKLVRPGGVLLLTTADYISVLSEVLRRSVAACIVPVTAPIARRLEVLLPIFEPHLATISSRTRPTEHWILDNIILPWRGKLFSMADAIDTLGSEFDILGSSPRVFTDWRWYKEIFEGQQRLNELAMDEYVRMRLSFLDCRARPVTAEVGRIQRLDRLARDVFDLTMAGETRSGSNVAPHVASCARQIAEEISPHLLPRTARALAEVESFLTNPSADPIECFDEFKSWFGQGQQYLSFVRRVKYKL